MNESNEWDDLFGDFADRITGASSDIRRAYNELSFFASHVMGYENPDYKEPSPFIESIYERLQFSEDKELLILGPRNSAKSQAATVNYTLWALGRNPLLRFLIVFAAKDSQGRQFSEQLASVIEKNERYHQVFGELKPGSKDGAWSWDRRTVKRDEPPGGLKGASITLGGLGANLPSMRADIIIVDDLVTGENAYSFAQQNSIENFVFSTLLPILEPEGRLIVVGSRWDNNDLYARLINKWRLEVPEQDPRISLDAILEASLNA